MEAASVSSNAISWLAGCSGSVALWLEMRISCLWAASIMRSSSSFKLRCGSIKTTAGERPYTARAFSKGSSTSAVLRPTRMDSSCVLHKWLIDRLSGPLIDGTHLTGAPFSIHVSVSAFSPFQHNIGALLPMDSKKPSVQLFAFRGANTHNDFRSCLFESCNALSGHLIVRIDIGDHHFWDLVFDDQVAARRGFPLMCTGFQIDVQTGLLQSFSIANTVYGMHFSVRLPCLAVPSLANDLSLAHDDTSYQRIGVSAPQAEFCQFNGPLHILLHGVKGSRDKCDFWAVNCSEFKAQCRARLEGVMQKQEITEVSRMLLEAFAEVDRKDILLHPDRPLQGKQEKKLMSALELIASGNPVQYVLGKVSFFGMDIHVGPEVLIPRPETEELLQLALERIGRAQTVLDVGTGSGILALGWKKKRPDSEVTGVDLSEKALGYARRNAEANGCNVEFFSMDFLDASNWYGLPVCDLILSNPPYVPQKESEEMAPHVLQHEPHLALFVPDDDPLLFYRSLLEFARSGVQKGGNIALEMHPPCAEDVCKMFSDEGFFLRYCLGSFREGEIPFC